MAGYIFGGNTGETPESLQRKRDMADMLAKSALGRAPRNVGEGLSAIGQALIAHQMDQEANKAATAGQDSANAAFNPIVAALGGAGAFPAAPGATSAPQASAAPTDYPSQRVAQAFAASGDTPSIPQGYFDAIRSAESGGSDSAKNPLSSATGRYQFTKGTWDGLMTAHPELGLTPEGRTDPTQQEKAIRVFTAQNAGQLQNAGIPVNGGDLYAAHFLGADGAKGVLTQPDNSPVSAYVSPPVVAANPFLKGMSVGQFKQWAASKGGGSAPGAAPMAFSQNVPADSSVAMSGPPPSVPQLPPAQNVPDMPVAGQPAPQQPVQVAQAANTGTPGQMSDADALKLLGASPVTRDAQGGPSLAMLLRSAANPWSNKNQSAVVSALLQQKLAASKPLAPVSVGAGSTLVDPRTGKIVYSNPKAGPAWRAATADELKRYGVPEGTPVEINDTTGELKAIGGSRGSVANESDITAIGDAIINGKSPPIMTGMYKNSLPLKAYLAKQGFNLTAATQDWDATKRLMATLNGPQQTRMRQAVGTVQQSLQMISDLNDKWQAGKYPPLNSIRNNAAKLGALGPQAQSIYTQLAAQIADVTGEMGTVLMGGNSPTDHAMELAAKNLDINSPYATLADSLSQMKENIAYRANSLKLGTAGIPQGTYNQNQSTPEIADPTVPVPAQVANPAAAVPPGQAPAPIRAVNPQTGQKIELQNGKWVPVQ